MGHFQDYEKNINELLNENDSYLVLYNGKAIRRNVNDDEVEVFYDDSFDPYEICERKRTNIERDIVVKSPFTITIHIIKQVKLKVIIINDTLEYSNIVYNINENTKAEIVKIYLDVQVKHQALVDIELEQNASLKYTSIQICKKEFKEILNAYLDEDASFASNTLQANKDIVNNESNVYLYGLHANAIINNSIINATGLTQNYNYNVYHWYNETTSELKNYAISKNTSSLNVNSNGLIKKGCAKSVINQKSRGIILDLHSTISANPLLQIDEYDVVANHGASIGAIDDEDLYYLMSRGLTKDESERLIVVAYIDPMIKNVDDETITNYINKTITSVVY